MTSSTLYCGYFAVLPDDPALTKGCEAVTDGGLQSLLAACNEVVSRSANLKLSESRMQSLEHPALPYPLQYLEMTVVAAIPQPPPEENPDVHAASTFASLCDRLIEQTAIVGNAEIVHFLQSPMPLLPTALPTVNCRLDDQKHDNRLDDAVSLFNAHGLVALSNALHPQKLESLREPVLTYFNSCMASLRSQEAMGNGNRFYEIMQRDPMRYDCRLPASVVPPNICEGGPWFPIVNKLLDGDSVLKMAGVVASMPGCGVQYWHSDGAHDVDSKGARWYEGDEDHCCVSPEVVSPSAICVFIPLVNLTTTNGYTEFWAGSHLYKNLLDKKGEQSLPGGTKGIVSMGDCLVYDFRVVHRGLSNTSEDIRPIMYLLYSREGFVEERNWGKESVFR